MASEKQVSLAMQRYAAEVFRIQQDKPQVSLSTLAARVKVMGSAWATAHELTDTFERGMNQELEDKMDEMAGRPTRCPHGEPIPTKEGVITSPKDAPLVEQEPGAAFRLSRVRTHDMDKLRYIGNLGLVPGVEFTLVSRAPFNGPLRLQFERSEQVIGFELASSLWVEKQKG